MHCFLQDKGLESSSMDLLRSPRSRLCACIMPGLPGATTLCQTCNTHTISPLLLNRWTPSTPVLPRWRYLCFWKSARNFQPSHSSRAWPWLWQASVINMSYQTLPRCQNVSYTWYRMWIKVPFRSTSSILSTIRFNRFALTTSTSMKQRDNWKQLRWSWV